MVQWKNQGLSLNVQVKNFVKHVIFKHNYFNIDGFYVGDDFNFHKSFLVTFDLEFSIDVFMIVFIYVMCVLCFDIKIFFSGKSLSHVSRNLNTGT